MYVNNSVFVDEYVHSYRNYKKNKMKYVYVQQYFNTILEIFI